MLRQTVVIVRAPALAGQSGTDQVQRDWDAATRSTVHGCNVQPVSSTETEDPSGVWASARWLLHHRGHLDIEATDRVEYDGMTLEVLGPPKQWPKSSGGWHHTEAMLGLDPLHRGASGADAVAAARTSAVGTAGRRWGPR